MGKKLQLSASLVIALVMASGSATAAGKGSGSSKTPKGDYRSAKSGQYVKKGYAEKHKSTTVREERQKK